MKSTLTLALLLILCAAAALGQGTATNVSIGTLSGSFTQSGLPAPGDYDMTFKIYDAATGGNVLWEEMRPVTVGADGLFHTEFGMPLDSVIRTLNTGGGKSSRDTEYGRWLEITAAAGEVIMPRFRLQSVPFAMGAQRLYGDVLTSPGHIYMVPGPPVSDCTYVPLEMAVDSTTSRIRLKPNVPVSDCTYVPLEMKVDTHLTSVRLFPPPSDLHVDSVEPAIEMGVDDVNSIFQLFGINPEPFRSNHREAEITLMSDATQSSLSVRHGTADPDVTPTIVMNTNPAEAIFWMMGVEPEPFAPDPSFSSFSVKANNATSEMILRHPITDPDKEPAIAMNVNPTSALFEVWGIDPEPFRAHSYEPSLSMKVENSQSSLTIHHQSVNAGGATDAAYMTLSSAPTSGASLVMFNPQPEPPGDPAMLMSMNSGPTTGASLLMFNPQPEPPGGPDDHTLSINGGLGDSGPGIFMFNPQPEPPGTPPYLLGMQTSPIGAMFEMQSEPGFAKAPSGINSIDINADTVSARIVALNAFTNAGGGVIHNEAAIVTNKTDARFTLRNGIPGSVNDFVVVANSGGAMVGINTPSPTEALHVVGDICATGTIGACSDERYKKDIETITNALSLIKKMRGVNFNWRTEEFPEQKFSESGQVGFIAQEIKEVLPELVSEGSDGFYSVDYAKLTPVLVEAVKEQQKSIEELKSQNSTLAQQLSELKSMVLRLTDASELTSGQNLAKVDN